MQCWIEAVSGSRAGSKIPIGDGRSVTFGRTRANEIFEDSAMSGLHFEIRSDGEKIGLKNHSQSNGTWVNGDRAEIVVLQPGDRIRAGETEFVLGIGEGPSAPCIQDWIFETPPAGWEMTPERGFRYAGDATHAITVLVSADRLPEGHDLTRYLDIQIMLISQRLPHAETSKTSASVPGAEASAGLAIRTRFADGQVAVQKQIYATVASKVGIVTATALENDLDEVHKGIERILKTAVFTAG